MTQDLIANNLGVRREGVTEAAGKLQRAGIIRYSRGHITVLDRPGLEQRACECYAVVKLEFTRLLSEILPGDPKQVLGKSSPD
jgi:Mn-dependent DtxR family transcriptional regulator